MFSQSLFGQNGGWKDEVLAWLLFGITTIRHLLPRLSSNVGTIYPQTRVSGATDAAKAENKYFLREPFVGMNVLAERAQLRPNLVSRLWHDSGDSAGDTAGTERKETRRRGGLWVPKSEAAPMPASAHSRQT